MTIVTMLWIEKACILAEQPPFEAIMRIFGVPLLCGALFSYFRTVKSSLVTFPSVVIPLSDLFDNQAASLDGTTGNFDGNGATYAAEYLPEGPWLYNGISVRIMMTFRLFTQRSSV